MSSPTPHRRYNPLRDSWVVVSPQRDQRPWQGQVEARAVPEPAYVEDCYLCPGNARAGGGRNPDYPGVYVFDNDFPALLDSGEHPGSNDPLLRSEGVRGCCRVICYSPRHNLTLADMPVADIGAVVDTWAEQTRELDARFEHVQVFENRGATMGCSNAHPHGQIWALDCQPTELVAEERCQRAYLAEHGSALLLDYARRELELRERVLASNTHWVVLVPWWATWPFETLLLPLSPVQTLPELDPAQRADLAIIVKTLLRAYNRLFDTPFPYSMGWHGAPKSAKGEHWQLHAHFYPPLLRSATVRKHMVGFEMLAEAQRDLTPERAAERLRDVMENKEK